MPFRCWELVVGSGARPCGSGMAVAERVPKNRMSTAEQTQLELPVPCDQERIYLPLGLLGFERYKTYLFRQRPEEAPFCWLEAVDCPELAFVVAPPADVI